MDFINLIVSCGNFVNSYYWTLNMYILWVKYFPGIYDFVPGATHIESQAGRHGSHVAVVYHLCWNADCGVGQRVCGAP